MGPPKPFPPVGSESKPEWGGFPPGFGPARVMSISGSGQSRGMLEKVKREDGSGRGSRSRSSHSGTGSSMDREHGGVRIKSEPQSQQNSPSRSSLSQRRSVDEMTKDFDGTSSVAPGKSEGGHFASPVKSEGGRSASPGGASGEGGQKSSSAQEVWDSFMARMGGHAKGERQSTSGQASGTASSGSEKNPGKAGPQTAADWLRINVGGVGMEHDDARGQRSDSRSPPREQQHHHGGPAQYIDPSHPGPEQHHSPSAESGEVISVPETVRERGPTPDESRSPSPSGPWRSQSGSDGGDLHHRFGVHQIPWSEA